MSEPLPTYNVQTIQPAKRDDRRYWHCPKCKRHLGRVVVHGDYYALIRHGALIIGDAWVRCHDCGTVRHWVEQLAKTPAFMRRMGERSAAERELLAEAEREIKELVSVNA